MHRLFVAICPPLVMRQQLLAIAGGIEGARWQGDEQLHLTLRFIGEVDRHQGSDIAAALGALRHPAFSITLDGVGLFDHRGRVNALWAGIAPNPALASLSQKVEQALVRAGMPPERRAFLPHITLARFGKLVGRTADFLASHAGLSSAAEPITEFRLYESELGQGGSHYHLIERYPLSH